MRTASITGTLLLTILLGLWGCSSPPPRQAPPPDTAVTQAPVTEPREPSLELPSSRFSVEYETAENYLDLFDWLSASDTLSAIPADQLNKDELAYLQFLQARIDYVRGSPERALATLARLQQLHLHPAIAYHSLLLQRQILDLRGDHLAAAATSQRLLAMAPESDSAFLRSSLWHSLQWLDSDELEAGLRDATGLDWRGWLELALLGRKPGVYDSLLRWRREYPGHAAAASLPGDIEVFTRPALAPSRVALLLPLSGRLSSAGKAVRDGYLASYYAASASGGARFELHIYDQDDFPSANAAYDTALSDGMDMLVGPLNKQAVAQIRQRQSLPLPVLALNRTTQSSTGKQGFIELALAPEDEARRVAELAFGQGARRALVLRPVGSWGDKVSRALLRRWRQLGGSVAATVDFTGQEGYSSAVEQGLGIPDSQARARHIRDQIQAAIEFTPRRRQDIDTVFLLARSGEEARSLKPLLAFHYAGDVPVYATSSIYSGVQDNRDRDLNGVNLVEIPWLLRVQNPLREAIAAGNTGSDAYARLNALGADAFLLQSRFSALAQGSDLRVRGHTGLLSLNRQGWIERELPPATFDRGVLRPR